MKGFFFQFERAMLGHR